MQKGLSTQTSITTKPGTATGTRQDRGRGERDEQEPEANGQGQHNVAGSSRLGAWDRDHLRVCDSDSLLDADGQRIAAMLKAAAAARGEPLRSAFDPASLMAQLRGLGFAEVRELGPEEANARYFAGRADGLRLLVPSAWRLMRARLGGVP